MQQALELAREAFDSDEVPVGALCVLQGEVVGQGRNRVEERGDASAHAELLAIKQASERLNRWRLTDVTLYSTLEPCIMCAGAIRLSRISHVVYGALDHRMGGFGSCVDLSQNKSLGPLTLVTGGILEDQSAEMLKSFFRMRRVD